MNRRLKMKRIRSVYVRICEIRPVTWRRYESPFFAARSDSDIVLVTNFSKRKWSKYRKAIVSHPDILFFVSYSALNCLSNIVPGYYGLHLRIKERQLPNSFWDMVK